MLIQPGITIVSAGPGSPSLLPLETADLLKQAPRIQLRTARHPLADWLRARSLSFSSFDDLYESSDDFDLLYEEMARRLLAAAEQGPLVYAVPDPAHDTSVDCLMDQASGVPVRVLPGVSPADAYLAAARASFRQSGIRIVSASALAGTAFDPSLTLLITELDTPEQAGDVKILLSDLLEDEMPVFFLQGGPDSLPRCIRIPLYEADRQTSYDHLSALLIPGSGLRDRSRHTLHDLETIMELLRAPGGCPWDGAQTHTSLKPYLVEEAWEAVSAIDDGDTDHLADELGDVLLQIVFHASIGRAFDEFTLTDVISCICRKMIARHPHVFGGAQDMADPMSDLSWEMLKRRETGSKTVNDSLEDVSPGLPSLKYAGKVIKKACQLEGFRRNPVLVSGDIRRLASLLTAADGTVNPEALGKLLLCCAELGRSAGLDPELLLHAETDRFKADFHTRWSEAEKQGKNPESLTFRED